MDSSQQPINNGQPRECAHRTEGLSCYHTERFLDSNRGAPVRLGGTRTDRQDFLSRTKRASEPFATVLPLEPGRPRVSVLELDANLCMQQKLEGL
jgi:hypothetical protein